MFGVCLSNCQNYLYINTGASTAKTLVKEDKMLYSSEVALVVLCVMLGVLRASGQCLDGQATCNEDTNSDPTFDKHPRETATNDREMNKILVESFSDLLTAVSSPSQQRSNSGQQPMDTVSLLLSMLSKSFSEDEQYPLKLLGIIAPMISTLLEQNLDKMSKNTLQKAGALNKLSPVVSMLQRGLSNSNTMTSALKTIGALFKRFGSRKIYPGICSNPTWKTVLLI